MDYAQQGIYSLKNIVKKKTLKKSLKTLKRMIIAFKNQEQETLGKGENMISRIITYYSIVQFLTNTFLP